MDATNSTNKDTVAEIERNEFVPKTFTSITTKKLPDKVKIDLDTETISIPVPPRPNDEPEEDTLINPKFFGDEKSRMDKWIKKLLSYRQLRMGMDTTT